MDDEYHRVPIDTQQVTTLVLTDTPELDQVYVLGISPRAAAENGFPRIDAYTILGDPDVKPLVEAARMSTEPAKPFRHSRGLMYLRMSQHTFTELTRRAREEGRTLAELIEDVVEKEAQDG